MKFLLTMALILSISAYAQTPVNMSAQSGLTYTEAFIDIANWTFNPTNDGTFTAGSGAAAWKGIINGGTGTIPTPANVTTRTTSFASSTSGGVQKGTQALVLLATGATDNTSSTAIDFFVNFSTLNAGTLSFDWSSINNSTGDRKASLKIYTSTNGVTFDPLPAADVLNITNNVNTSGSVSNIALPAALNNSATARIRLYYYNGTGGTAGSRPKISIDNFKVTAVPSVPCTTPIANPSALSFGSITNTSIAASFTAPSTAPSNYLVLQSNYSTLSSTPQNNITYNIGDNIGDATVIALTSATSFTAAALNPLSNYYFYIFSVNNLCSGGPLYQVNNPLTGNAATLSGTANCTVPPAQPTALTFPSVTSNIIQGTFTAAAAADEYLVVRTTTPTLSANPLNGTQYNTGDILGNGIVISRSSANSFSTAGLNAGTTYYFTIFAINSQSCNNGPVYLTTTPLKANTTTPTLSTCATPTAQPANLSTAPSNTSITGSFAPSATADSYLILYSTSGTLTAFPQNNTNYSVGSTIGNATVGAISAATAFTINGLAPSTAYNIFVFAANTACTGGSRYLSTTPLTSSVNTTATAQYNYYFGNLHAHSYYSDGNKDQPNATPANNYTYAQNSLCLDFLGISEHNHAGAGMNISKWQPGLAQAAASTTPNFLALYGMEWGVISGGGHVIVYGQDKLMGWETNNYDIFVPKSDYIGTPATTGTTGLFRAINTAAPSTFATLAHPANSDFNSLSTIAYNANADSAIVGVAIETGPAFSTSQTYNDPSSITFLSYYNKLLSKGYKLGPTIDHDNHNTTFGRTTYARLAVIAPSLDTAAFFNAMKNMNFYATEDCDTRIMFTINNQLMGSSIAGANAPAISITATDPSSPAAIPTIKLMSGTPGSGVSPVQIASATSGTLTFTDNSLSTNNTAYYYADITINGARSITSPIWYTKANTTFYSKSSGNLSLPQSWGTNPDGTGTMPADFTTGTFILSNRPTYSLTSNLTIGGTLSIPSGAALTLNGFLLSIANITGTGTLTGSTTSSLVITGTTGGSAGTLYFSNGFQSLGNLTINRTGASASVSLGSPLDIYGTLTLSSGTFITNNQLTLKSNISATARLAPVTNGTIAGNVTVERYVPNIGRRAWRIIGVPASGSQTIFQSWQDTAKNRPAIGTLITSNAYTPTNGFDTFSAKPSILTHQQGGSNTPAWVPVTNTNATILSSNPGYLIYVRGDRTATATNSIITPTILRTTGTLRTGNQPAVTVSSTGSGYTLVCNPFPSAIDIETFVTAANLNQSFYLWDPTIAGNYGLGAFRLVTRLSAGNYEATPSNTGQQSYRYIQSGECLFLKAFGSNASVTFSEANKTVSLPTPSILRSQSTTSQLTIHLLNDGSDTTILDGVRIKIDTAFDNAVTIDDALKMQNPGESISILVHDTLLALEQHRETANKDTIYLSLSQLQPKTYRLSINANQFHSVPFITLHDKYTNQSYPLDISTENIIPFSVNPDTASRAPGRFYLSFEKQITLPLNDLTLKAYRNDSKINIEWNKPFQSNVLSYDLQKSKDGVSFTTIALIAPLAASQYRYSDVTPNSSYNYYRLKVTTKQGNSIYSNIAAVNFSHQEGTIDLANLITGNTINLKMLFLPAGNYTYKLVTQTGQTFARGNFFHDGQNQMQLIQLPEAATGMYFLQIILPDKRTITKKLSLF